MSLWVKRHEICAVVAWFVVFNCPGGSPYTWRQRLLSVFWRVLMFSRQLVLALHDGHFCCGMDIQRLACSSNVCVPQRPTCGQNVDPDGAC
jgi:hypothetical protein